MSKTLVESNIELRIAWFNLWAAIALELGFRSAYEDFTDQSQMLKVELKDLREWLYGKPKDIG